MTRYHMQKRELEIRDKQAVWEVVARGKYTTLAMASGREPYVVTLNHGLDRDRQALYFHCALEGQKIDILRENPRVCGTVIEDQGYQNGQCNHLYRSVVFWGELHEVTTIEEKRHALNVLIDHLEPQPEPVKGRLLKNNTVYHKVIILRLDIAHITGKQGV